MAEREGIDSQQERDLLNYRPRIEYTLPKVNAGDYTGGPAQQIQPNILMAPVLPTVWDDVVKIAETLDSLESELSDKLKNDKVPVTSSAVIEAAKRYDYVVTTHIPFDLYKKALYSLDSLEKTIITDTYENHHADVDGDINAELYTDVVEMQLDWVETIKFINKGLFGQFVSIDKLPTTLDANDPAMKGIYKSEQDLIDRLISARKSFQTSLNKLRELHLSDPNGEKFFAAQKETSTAKQQLKVAERAVYSRTEVYNLVDSKASDYNLLSMFITNAVDFKPYEKNLTDILTSVLNQYGSGQAMEKGLRRIQALIKLSVDGKNEGVTNTKQDLRGAVSLANRKRLNNELVNGIQLRNGVFGEVHDVMDNFDGIPDNAVFNVFANHIVDSVVYADKMYEDQSLEFLKVHALESELRRNKLRSLVDKDSAREIYKLIDKLVAYAKDRGWPTATNLSSWVTAFMKVENLN